MAHIVKPPAPLDDLTPGTTVFLAGSIAMGSAEEGTYVDIKGADLRGADLSGANLVPGGLSVSTIAESRGA